MQNLVKVCCAAGALVALAACSDSVLTSPTGRVPTAVRSSTVVLSTTTVCSDGATTVQTHAGIPPLPGSFGPTVAAVIPGTLNAGWHAPISGSNWIIPGNGAGNGPFGSDNAPNFVSSHYSVQYTVPNNAVSPAIVGQSYADNQVAGIFIDNGTGGTSLGSNSDINNAANYGFGGESPLSWGGSTPTGTHTLDFYVANNDVTQPTNPTALDFCFHVEYTLPPPPPVVAQFVIGDVEPHAIGDVVNFWGSQWWKSENNQFSGTVDPGYASMKGFADISGNACGLTWQTLPGNSSKPPAPPLPDDIAVIVTSTVGKTGNNLSGNIVEIVIVHQDGKYKNDPGHAGHGTVTSVVCSSVI